VAFIKRGGEEVERCNDTEAERVTSGFAGYRENPLRMNLGRGCGAKQIHDGPEKSKPSRA
jgi:hypothetical protein